MKSHPEGGYFAEVFKSNCLVKSIHSQDYKNETRSAGTSIYYLLNKNDFSAWHRLKSDELWHYYKGSAIKIHIINSQGMLTTYLLGDTLKNNLSVFQVTIPSGCWFAAELEDKTSYGFIGCTVNPGFKFKDFELADRALLSNQFPQHEKMITLLTP